jgi:hypothetical protein
MMVPLIGDDVLRIPEPLKDLEGVLGHRLEDVVPGLRDPELVSLSGVGLKGRLVDHTQRCEATEALKHLRLIGDDSAF